MAADEDEGAEDQRAVGGQVQAPSEAELESVWFVAAADPADAVVGEDNVRRARPKFPLRGARQGVCLRKCGVI
jgi:hypothetical protein